MKQLSKRALFDCFEKIDIKIGDTVLLLSGIDNKKLHISERQFLINTLMEYLGSDGTIIMSLTGANSDARHIIDEELLSDLNNTRDLMPAYSVDRAYLYANDVLAKTLLLNRAAVVSDHFTYPYVGLGVLAKLILSGQSDNFPNGQLSPLARLYELRAKAILIDYDIFDLPINHYIADTDYKSEISVNGGKVVIDGDNVWSRFLERKVDLEKFEKLSKLANYKKLFYYDEVANMKVLSVSIRDYTDYCRKNI